MNKLGKPKSLKKLRKEQAELSQSIKERHDFIREKINKIASDEGVYIGLVVTMEDISRMLAELGKLKDKPLQINYGIYELNQGD